MAAAEKTADEKFCEKLVELYGDAMKDCADDALKDVKKCSNTEEVMDCVGDASDKDGAKECYKKCKKK